MTLDIAFVVDFSGSMAPVLEGIKTEIVNIAKNIAPAVKAQCNGINLLMRLALVPFRDLGDAAMQGMKFVTVPVDINESTVDAFNTAHVRLCAVQSRPCRTMEAPAPILSWMLSPRCYLTPLRPRGTV